MSTETRKVQKLKGQIDLVQDANIPALEQIGKEIELHLEQLANNMASSFWTVYKKQLMANDIEYKDIQNFMKTELWRKSISGFLTDKSQNYFLRDKLSLNDYLAKFLKRYYEKRNKVEVL